MGATHAHVHEPELVADLPDDLLHGFYETWFALEEQIKGLNDTKAAMLARVRAEHGKIAADALKIAMRLAAQDPAKRTRDDFLSGVARRYVRGIEGQTGVRSRFDQ